MLFILIRYHDDYAKKKPTVAKVVRDVPLAHKGG